MTKSRLLPFVSAVSLGIGGLLGASLKSQHNSSSTDGDSKETLPKHQNHWYQFQNQIQSLSSKLSSLLNINLFDVVNAAVKLPPAIIKDKDVPDSVPLVLPPPSVRAGQIMRFGFPSLDNVKSFDDYMMSYDKRNRIPHWVFEHLSESSVRIKTVDRENFTFNEDQSIHPYFRATNIDYRGSGYDRGHLSAAANHRISHKSCEQTFLLSNIAPQIGNGFNRHAWNDLERYVRHLAKKYKNVYVCTGPLFLPRREQDGKIYVKYEVIGPNQVSVPTHFFKVVAAERNSGEFDLYSFVLPNQSLPEKVDLKAYLVPIETIERASGLLFFEKLPRNALRLINGQPVR